MKNYSKINFDKDYFCDVNKYKGILVIGIFVINIEC